MLVMILLFLKHLHTFIFNVITLRILFTCFFFLQDEITLVLQTPNNAKTPVRLVSTESSSKTV